MKNRNWLLLLLVTTILIPFVSCTKDPNTAYLGNWIKNSISPLGGVPRAQACAFVIDTDVYVGLGVDIQGNCLDDFWQWDTNSDKWTRIDSMRGANGKVLPGRQSAVAFAIDTIGYVGTGEGPNYAPTYKDFYSYSPKTNKWTALTSDAFPGTPRYGCVAFSVNHLGFIGGGFDNNYLNDYYKFNPSLPPGKRWILQAVATIGEKRLNGGVFVIGAKAYLCTGTNGSQLCDDMVIYDSAGDTWRTSDTTLSNQTETTTNFNNDYTDIIRQGAALFAVNGKGYVTWGASMTNTTSLSGKTWEYDPATGLWTRKTTFPVQYNWSVGEYTVGVTVSVSGKSDRGFVGTGQSSGTLFIDQFYEFKPETQYIQGD